MSLIFLSYKLYIFLRGHISLPRCYNSRSLHAERPAAATTACFSGLYPYKLGNRKLYFAIHFTLLSSSRGPPLMGVLGESSRGKPALWRKEREETKKKNRKETYYIWGLVCQTVNKTRVIGGDF